MQNQPGPEPRNHNPAEARHDSQAAGLSEDVFKGGSVRRMPRSTWLRNPWTPAGGRLWPRRGEADES